VAHPTFERSNGAARLWAKIYNPDQLSPTLKQSSRPRRRSTVEAEGVPFTYASSTDPHRQYTAAVFCCESESESEKGKEKEKEKEKQMDRLNGSRRNDDREES
jgi:hypothetical protein